MSSDIRQLLKEIEADARYTATMTGRPAFAPGVMAAVETVPREAFVPAASRHQAYYNGPLPIGNGQTISQPYIVALMTDLLDPGPDDVMLEVGTGSGYQAAVLSRVVRHVYSVEVLESLSRRAQEVLKRLGYDNVSYRVGDGYHGWPEQGPFDGIIVTAAAPAIPAPLVDQLKPGARMVIPVGPAHGFQELMVVDKDASGETTSRSVLGVAFVPLTREAGED